MTPPAASDAGLSLVEVLVSLALFALIALAGFTFLNGVLRVREGTDGRIERLGRMQRTLYLLSLDLEQASPGPLVLRDGGLGFRRRLSPDRPPSEIRYALADETLVRSVGGSPTGQPMLPGVSAVRWTFWSRGRGWSSDPGLPTGTRPQAVAVELDLQGSGPPPHGLLRRVMRLPDQT